MAMISCTPDASRKGKLARRGLTLLELVVVLTVLVALAGILVPMVSNILPYASSSAGATNATEVERVVQLCLSLPQNKAAGPYNPLDLLDNLAESGGTVASYVPNNSTATSPDIVPYPLNSTSPVVTSLSAVGIQNVYQLVESTASSAPPWSPTFFPYSLPASTTTSTAILPTPTPLADVTYVAALNSIAAAQKFGVSSSGTYVVFGLGKDSAMAGAYGSKRYLQEVPVAFNPNAGNGPNSVYCRFGLVFQVDPVAGTSDLCWRGGV